jgi:hypothetical protein
MRGQDGDVRPVGLHSVISEIAPERRLYTERRKENSAAPARQT